MFGVPEANIAPGKKAGCLEIYCSDNRAFDEMRRVSWGVPVGDHLALKVAPCATEEWIVRGGHELKQASLILGADGGML